MQINQRGFLSGLRFKWSCIMVVVRKFILSLWSPPHVPLQLQRSHSLCSDFNLLCYAQYFSSIVSLLITLMQEKERVTEKPSTGKEQVLHYMLLTIHIVYIDLETICLAIKCNQKGLIYSALRSILLLPSTATHYMIKTSAICSEAQPHGEEKTKKMKAFSLYHSRV